MGAFEIEISCPKIELFIHNMLQRCLGVRFLFPVYYVPEVEISPLRAYTSVETLEKGKGKRNNIQQLVKN